MKRKPVCLISMTALLLAAAGPAAGNPDALVAKGRSHLAAYKKPPHAPAELLAADDSFGQACAAAPTHPEANIYHALTRLMVLMHEDAVREQIDAFGWSAEGRNYWKWSATLPPTLPDPDFDSAKFSAVLKDAVSPRIDEVVAGLDRIPTDWSGSFLISSNEIPGKTDREADAGDVAVLSFFLRAARAMILLQSAYDNHAVVENAFGVNEQGKLTTRPVSANDQLFGPFPKLGTVVDPDKIAEAKQEADAAAAAYVRAKTLIGQETDSQKDDLFGIDMVKWADPYVNSLSGPQTIQLAEGMTGQLDGRRLFTAPYVNRSHMPEYNEHNDVILGTFPDPTFNGLYPDMTQDKLSRLLRWMHRNSGVKEDLFDVAWGNGRFVAVGEDGVIVTSPDSRTWTRAEAPVEAALKGVCFGNGFFVAVGDGGTAAISQDGSQWMVRESGVAAKLESVTFARGRFVAVGEGGVILVSATGQAWDPADSGVTETLRAVAGGERGFVAVGNRGVILSSTDGQRWTSRESGTADALIGVAAGPRGYAATGYKGVLLESPDGETWSVRPGISDRHGHDVCDANGQWLAVGAKGTIAESKPGQGWTRQVNRSRTDLWGVAPGESMTVAVGSRGRIIACDNANLTRSGSGLAAFPQIFSLDDVEREVRGWTGRSRTRVVDSRNEWVAKRQAESRVPPTLKRVAPSRAGETFAVSVAGFPVDQRDPNAWIGFYRTGANDREYVSYTFLKNLVDDLYDVPIPVERGTYEFRLFEDGGYNRIAVSEAFEVE